MAKRKTVAELAQDVNILREEASNVQFASGTVHNHAQLGAVIEKYSRYGELIKAEVTIGHSPGKNAYSYQIWHRPLLNKDSRKRDEYVIAGMSGHDFTPIRE